MLNFLKALRRDERGVSALEYAILAAVIVGLVAAGVNSLEFGELFTNVNTAIDNAITPSADPG